MDLLTTLLYILFVLAAIVLIVVVLLQEGKGGGLGQALGEGGQQTIGVGAKGINTFTGWVAVIFLGSAISLHLLNRTAAGASVVGEDSVLGIPGDPTTAAPLEPGAPPK
ncbi:MAG: preprotein translocase subunit SecG [Planctomycetota bacterium]